MRKQLTGLALAAMLLVPQSMVAGDAALIVVENNYRQLPDVAGAYEAAHLAKALEAAGFSVTSSLDQAAGDVWATVAHWRQTAASADHLLVFLSGHVVSTPRESYLLTHSAETVSDLSVGSMSLPIGPLLDILATRPGRAVLLLAPAPDRVAGQGLQAGAAPEMPQGVTLFTGAPGALDSLAENRLLVPGTALGTLPSGITASGFVASSLPFLNQPAAGPTRPGAPAQADRETTFWDLTRSIDTADGYRAYLDRYPNGRYAPQARSALARISADAQARLEAGEAALGLDAEARRQVQRNLALIGYDPHGIDGIFGHDTRTAIAAFQRDSGVPATGYLTTGDLGRLADQAKARAAQLEAEAAARKAQEERQDRAYWAATGQAGDEAGLRAYLARYPDGVYADVAQSRLDSIEANKRARAAAQEGAAWDQAKKADTVPAYRNYLDKYPKGSFAEDAQARIDELTAADAHAADVAAAKDEEARVAGNKVTRLLVESRLKAKGYDPGRVDGNFDKAARRAIRRFQRDSDLTVTGFVTQNTMVRLLAAG